ncbi:MAG: PilZ domain-containing protein [Alphaproteobacteria bacterium]|nr:PilZ domain-containing protein [Alphaproteobacteria bacterium]MBV9372747.1 PilZ domain-containing protein [Alphaproteobacteria bacterium]MBV9900904.1 PilZ domain-containing protein [Alphaproteobacteria bacterium]
MLSSDCHQETIFSFSDKAPLPPEDRRRDPRHLTILRVGALISEGGRELCLIRNISAGGVMAHVYARRTTGERVAIELKSNHRIPGFVVWVSGSNVGIQFDEPVDVAGMLSNQSMLENGWRPRLPRIEVDRLATLRCGADLYGVNTRDISQGGVKIETDQSLEMGAAVVLTLDRFRPIHGVVRWCSEGLAGIAFNQLIPFQELMEWLKPDGAA